MYASFSFNPVEINRNLSFLAGARLIYVFHGQYAVGFGSFNMISRDIKADFIDSETQTRPTLEYNFFSTDFEYFFNPGEYYMFSAKSSINLAHVRYNLISTELATTEMYSPDFGENWFVFVEPSVNLTLNLTKWMRTAFGVGYRIALNGNYVYGDSKFGNKELSGFSGGVYLFLGNF